MTLWQERQLYGATEALKTKSAGDAEPQEHLLRCTDIPSEPSASYSLASTMFSHVKPSTGRLF